MKRILLASITIILAISLNAQQTGTFKDPRDGKTYKTVKIGNQTWMAENLAFKPNSGNYWAYDNNNSNVVKYGYFYDWQTAKNFCLTGWHLPSDAEWTQLINFVGGEDNACTKLKGKSGWSDGGNGTDDYGFTALPGGGRYGDGSFDTIGYHGFWWSATENGPDYAWSRYLYYKESYVNRDSYHKEVGFSVRCLRD